MTRTPFLDTILAEIQKKRLFQRRKRAVVTEMSRRSAGNAGAARGLSDTRVALAGNSLATRATILPRRERPTRLLAKTLTGRNRLHRLRLRFGRESSGRAGPQAATELTPQKRRKPLQATAYGMLNSSEGDGTRTRNHRIDSPVL
jgi:hypothetical protein